MVRMNNQITKESISRVLLIFIPCIFLGLILDPSGFWEFIFETVPISIGIIAVGLMLFTLVCLYYYFVTSSQQLSYKLITFVRGKDVCIRSKYGTSFWTLISRVKSRRRILLSFFLILLAFLFITNLFYLLRINAQMFHLSFLKLYLVLSIPIIILLLFNFYNNIFGQNSFIEVNHKKQYLVKQMIDNLTISSGIGKPDYKIIKSQIPTSFTKKIRSKHVIYFTSALLNITEKSEIEAVIGHQIANIISGRNNYEIVLNVVFNSIKGLIYILFIIWFAINIKNPLVGYLLMFALFVSLMLIDSWSYEANKSFSKVSLWVVKAVNPVYVISNIIIQLSYFILIYNETIYADLKSISYTRNPKGLYSILSKLENYKTKKSDLPASYHHLFFTGERYINDDIPFPQAPITIRKQVIENVDKTLKLFSKSIKSNLTCVLCSQKMEEVKLIGKYEQRIFIDICHRCGSVWFDDLELAYILQLETLLKLKPKSNYQFKAGQIVTCPKCGNNLQELTIFPNKPQRKIKTCTICHGYFIPQTQLTEIIKIK